MSIEWEAIGLSVRLAAIVCAVLLTIGLPLAYWLTFSTASVMVSPENCGRNWPLSS